MIPGGIRLMNAANLGENERMTANTAASLITLGSYTLERARTPVFSPYVVFAGAPKSDASDVARPSPRRVLLRPGSLMKFLLHVAEIAEISPICSIIVAIAIGTIAIIAEIAFDLSECADNRLIDTLLKNY